MCARVLICGVFLLSVNSRIYHLLDAPYSSLPPIEGTAFGVLTLKLLVIEGFLFLCVLASLCVRGKKYIIKMPLRDYLLNLPSDNFSVLRLHFIFRVLLLCLLIRSSVHLFLNRAAYCIKKWPLLFILSNGVPLLFVLSHPPVAIHCYCCFIWSPLLAYKCICKIQRA